MTDRTRHHRHRTSGALALVAMLTIGMTACGGDPSADVAGPSTVTSEPTAADMPAPDATADDAAAPSTPPVPASALGATCEALVVELLQTIEPFVEGLDLADVNADDFDADGLAASSAGIEERIEQECPAMDNDDAYAMMIDLARGQAPGAVWYLEEIAAAHAARSGG